MQPMIITLTASMLPLSNSEIYRRICKMFYYYLGAITFALVTTRIIWRVISHLEHPRKHK